MEGYPEPPPFEATADVASAQEALSLLEAAAAGESRVRVTPTVLAELQQAAQDCADFDKASSPEGTSLRDRLVVALFSEGTIEDVLPFDGLHSATKLLVGAHLKRELEIGLRVRELNDLVEHNPQALPARMLPALSARDRLALEGDDLLSVQGKRVLFRTLIGYSGKSIAEFEGVTGSAISLAKGRIRNKLAGLGYVLEDILAQSEPLQPRNSIFHDLERCLPLIDQECRIMSGVMEGGFDYPVVASLVESDLDAGALLFILLRTYNKGNLESITDPRLAQEWASSAAASKRSRIGIAYRQQHADLVDSYQEKRIKAGVKKEYQWEDSYEVEQLVLKAIAAYNEKKRSERMTLTPEAETELAMRIEEGMWAEIYLELTDPDSERRAQTIRHIQERYGQDVSALSMSDASIKELQELASMGRDAYFCLLEHNVGLAKYYALRSVFRYRLQVGETEEDRLQAVLVSAMKGVVRAIRKFDYRLEVPFAGYANRWIKNFVVRALYESWGLTAKQGEEMGRVGRAEERLEQDSGREVTEQEIADETGLTLEKVRRLRGVRSKYQYGSKAKVTKTTADLGGPSQKLTPDTVELISDVLDGNPELIQVILLHFEDRLTPAEIAEHLDLPEHEVSRRLSKALVTLGEVLRPENLAGN